MNGVRKELDLERARVVSANLHASIYNKYTVKGRDTHYATSCREEDSGF